MADFFANLIDRALERRPVLEPRRPSLFEPDKGQSWPARIDPSWDGEEQLQEPALEPDHLERRAESRLQTTPDPLSPGREVPEPGMPEGRLRPVGPQPSPGFSLGGLETIVAEQLHLAMRDFLQARTEVTAAVPPGQSVGTERREAASPGNERTAREHPSVGPGRSPASNLTLDLERQTETIAIKKTQPVHQDPDTDTEKTPRPFIPREVPTIVPESAFPHQRAAEPAAVKRARAMPPPDRRRLAGGWTAIPHAQVPVSQATPPPAIQVSVGRVEVRANMGHEPQAPRSKRAKPTMSLDEYMRVRGGGFK